MRLDLRARIGAECPAREYMVSLPDHDQLPVVVRAGLRDQAAGLTDGPELGLSIVRRVSEMHGATATARNALEGGGLMTIIFPPLSDSPPRGVTAIVGAGRLSPCRVSSGSVCGTDVGRTHTACPHQ